MSLNHEPSTRFTVASFNMQFGQTWDPQDPDSAPVDLEATIDLLRQIDADVILLQEIEHVDRGLGQVQPPPNFARISAALKGYESWFAYPKPDQRELPFGYGLAIFSRTPLYDCRSVDLPAPELSFVFEGHKTQPTDRLLIGASTRIGGREIRIFNTHLQAFFMIDARSDDFPAQRERVLEVLGHSTAPTILGGDFNCAPDESLLNQFAAAGYRTAQSETITWKRMPYVLDHLLYNDALECIESTVQPTNAADHDIVIATFALRN